MCDLIADTIRQTRQRLGLSQRAFAERAGLGQNMVVRAEKGEDLRLSTLFKLCKAAGLTIRLVPIQEADDHDTA